ncbi:Uncharacterised protein [Bordetella pertussis]|nr:Uncharacterised protein [Bordetella pertussis]
MAWRSAAGRVRRPCRAAARAAGSSAGTDRPQRASATISLPLSIDCTTGQADSM